MERPQAPRKKAAGFRPSPAKRKAKNPGQIRVKCKEATVSLDFSGGETKRFYQLETLGSSVEGLLNRGDSWLMVAIKESTQGLAPLSVNMELQWENSYSLAFKVTAAVSQGKPGSVLLVSAKNHQEHMVRLQGEIEALRILTARGAAGLLPVRSEGTLYLPNKLNRADGKGRQVLAYVRAWTGPYAATELRPNGQYVMIQKDRKLLSRTDSETYGESLALLLFQAFDPLTRNAPSLNSLHWGDVLCRVSRTTLSPTLMHCPRVTRYRSIQAYLKGVLLWEPAEGSDVFPMQMIAPEALVEILRKTLGGDLAAEAVRRLSTTGGDDSVPEAYVESLRAAMQA